MGSKNKEEMARREGMAYALRIAKEKGIEGLEEELKFRNVTEIPIGVSRSACNEVINRIKENTVDTIMVLSAMTLRDEFDFGQVRIQRFCDRFSKKTECLVENYCTWSDMIETMRDECGLHFSIREFNENVRC